MTPLLVPISDGSIIPAAYRAPSDAEILRSAAEVLDRRLRGFGEEIPQALRDMAGFVEALDKMKERVEEWM